MSTIGEGVATAKNRSPFTKKGTKLGDIGKLNSKPKFFNDEASLTLRAQQRKYFDLSAVSLEICNQTSSKPFERSFIKTVNDYPHHEILIKQLLHGAQLDIGNRVVAFQTHQDCYYGIEDFIACLNSAGMPIEKQIHCLADIDYQTTKAFCAYMLQRWPGRTVNRKRYGRLRSVVQQLHTKFDGEPYFGKTIAWAQSPSTTDTPSESYPDHIFNQFVEASLSDIKFIMKMMKSYPATLAKYRNNIQDFNYTVNPIGRINNFSVEESAKYVSALVMTAAPDWPLYVNIEKANFRFSMEWFENPESKGHPDRWIYRALVRMRIEHNIRDHASGKIKTIEMHVGQLAYFSQFFFTVKTLYPFLLFVQINTGWNLEAILSISDDIDDHIGDDLIDPDQYVLIYGSKWRTNDVLRCRSNKVEPYSVYNLLKFVQNQIKPFKDSLHYRSGHLWQAIINKNLWNKHGKVVAVFDQTTIGSESLNFLQRHSIVISENSPNSAIESRRLRTTWETKRKEHGLPVENISLMMGHSDLDTTVISYDSDAGSTNLRDRKLRELQGKWESDFRDYGVRLSTSTTLHELRTAIKNGNRRKVVEKVASEIGCGSKEVVVHLLSPEGQTYIVACLDATNPTWPDARRFVGTGSKCSFFNRCCMCKEAVVFKESLPYIARRMHDLDSLKSRITTMEWAANYGEEASAWENILKRWNPTTDVDEAKLQAMKSEFALPMTMRGPQ